MIDSSNIPSVCRYTISNGCNSTIGAYACTLEEFVRGRRISSLAFGNTQQEAIDSAIRKFRGE